MKKNKGNISKGRFTLGVVLVFLLSFGFINWYFDYHLKASKEAWYVEVFDQLLQNSISRDSLIDSEVSALHVSDLDISTQKLAKSKSIEQPADTPMLLAMVDDAGIGVKNENEESDLVNDEVNVLPTAQATNYKNDVLATTVSDAGWQKMTRKRFNSLSIDDNDELSTRSVDFDEYVLERKRSLKRLNWYVGGGVHFEKISEGLYRDADLLQLTTGAFEQYVGSTVNDRSSLWFSGGGAMVFGGVQLNPNWSIQSGLSLNNIWGEKSLAVVHSYIKKLDRIEWIATGETDQLKPVKSNDYTHLVSNDTITVSFIRQSVHLPLIATYQFDGVKWRPFVSAGASLSFLYSAYESQKSTLLKKGVIKKSAPTFSQLSAHIGAGLDYKLAANWAARTHVNYDHGIANFEPGVKGATYNSLSLNLGAYYKF